AENTLRGQSAFGDRIRSKCLCPCDRPSRRRFLKRLPTAAHRGCHCRWCCYTYLSFRGRTLRLWVRARIGKEVQILGVPSQVALNVGTLMGECLFLFLKLFQYQRGQGACVSLPAVFFSNNGVLQHISVWCIFRHPVTDKADE